MSKKAYLRDGRAPIPINENISRVMSANKAKNTKPELNLRKELWKANIKGYRLHPKNIAGKPDIAFLGKKVAIFVNGCFWHRCPICNPSQPKTNVDFWITKFQKNIDRDNLKTETLINNDWKVLVIWECQIKKDIVKVVKNIKAIISK